MSLVKPRALPPRALLGIVSPASAAKPELVAAGVAALEGMGYRTKVFPHALKHGPLNYAGSVAERGGDLHRAFEDDAVDAILCTRGGWGCAELLPHLDAGLIRAHPKAFLGYSDLTSLHVWLRRETGLVSFNAPMVAADFAKTDGVDAASWTAALTQVGPWSLGVQAGLRVLRPGLAEGMLHGGCMSIYAEAIGTPYAPLVEGGVLFLEDVGVKPYQWDRMLLHLRYAGLLEGVTGMVFGDMAQCCEAAEEQALLDETLLYALRHFTGPVATGLRSGHVGAANITLPLGVRVRLDCTVAGNPRMDFLESAVRV